MQDRVVADNRTIINTQGIRFVEKVDSTPGGTVRHELRVTYKGDKLDYRYESSHERDEQFDRLRRALTSPPAADAVDPAATSQPEPTTRDKSSSDASRPPRQEAP